ncbi:MAG TPA: V-type ATP synthase subunit E family protein [Candidatus Hydrogenedentes bacterium]|mgnify:CR=1 FL=1|nr:V-type ATP synthase subunit E family protein [Candidatus Hydrogenedentota bacterium]HPG70005.1 V-type ATP synthase subunit E family protein [Candidatus Hydrogenedentota bacterium]
MALENISNAVLGSARTEAEHILKAAEKAAEAKVAAARAAAEQDGERRFQSAVRAIEEEFGRKLIQAKGTANKELLARKNACLQRIFEEARARIVRLPADQYANTMGKLLRRAASEGGGRLRVHAEDRRVFVSLLADINKGRSPEARIELDDTHPLAQRGGFIFVGDGFQVDQTLATLLADAERELAPAIASDVLGG